MPLFFRDLVRELSRSSGAGDFVLEGAVPGHRRFAGTVPAGARFHYAIAGATNPHEWETGEGEIGSGGALVRAPLASSAGGGLVDFSAGLKTVALTVGAAWFEAQDAAANVDVAALQAAIEGKAEADHDHDGDYAPAGHHHDNAYQPLDAELAAIAGLTGAPDRVAYFTGPGAAALAPLTGFGRSLIDDSDAAAGRATLGLGSAATRSIGTSGASVPLLNAANSWSAAQTINAPLAYPLTLDSLNALKLVFAQGGNALGGFGASASYIFATLDPTLSFYRFTVADGGGSPSLLLNQIRVVGTRRTGWSAATGSGSRGSFDTASVTTAQLAERVKALIDDLIAHGLIGA